jgi:hypothetical protein
MALPRATDVEYIGANGSGGMVFGYDSSEKIGFYGKAPIVRPVVTAAATTATTATNEAAIVRLTAALVNLGLITTV